MKITITKGIRNPDWEAQGWLEIEVNGKRRVIARAPEPEDATLERDMSFAYDIVPLMKEAWEAGKRGEDFVVTERKGEDE